MSISPHNHLNPATVNSVPSISLLLSFSYHQNAIILRKCPTWLQQHSQSPFRFSTRQTRSHPRNSFHRSTSFYNEQIKWRKSRYLGPSKTFKYLVFLCVFLIKKAFTRTVSAVYGISLLFLFLRTKVNILGRYLYLDATVTSNSTEEVCSQGFP